MASHEGDDGIPPAAARELAELTGVSLEEAQHLLASHEGDANAAAGTFFAGGGAAGDAAVGADRASSVPLTTPASERRNISAARTGTTRDAGADIVDGILDNARPASPGGGDVDGSRGASFAGRGHRLDESTPTAASGRGGSVADDGPTRDITVVFYRDGLTMHEQRGGNAGRGARQQPHVRKTGMHTFDDSSLPSGHPHPDLAAGGDYIEVVRVSAAAAGYQGHLLDLQQGRVPRLKALTDTPPGTQFRLILRDSRAVAMPAAIPIDGATAKGLYSGPGQVLGGGGGASGAASDGSRPNTGDDRVFLGFSASELTNVAVGVGAAVATPIMFWQTGMGSPTLSHAIAGATVGLMTLVLARHYRARANALPKFAISHELPQATVRVRLAATEHSPAPRTQTLTFNPTVHTVGDLYNRVQALASVTSSGQAAASFTLLGGYPPCPLQRNDERTLKQAGLGNTQVVQRV